MKAGQGVPACATLENLCKGTVKYYLEAASLIRFFKYLRQEFM